MANPGRGLVLMPLVVNLHVRQSIHYKSNIEDERPDIEVIEGEEQEADGVIIGKGLKHSILDWGRIFCTLFDQV